MLCQGASSPSIPVFLFEEGLNEARGAVTNPSMTAVMMSRGAFLVDQGTRVLVVETGNEIAKVRVLDGLWVGNTGFVLSKWCRE